MDDVDSVLNVVSSAASDVGDTISKGVQGVSDFFTGTPTDAGAGAGGASDAAATGLAEAGPDAAALLNSPTAGVADITAPSPGAAAALGASPAAAAPAVTAPSVPTGGAVGAGAVGDIGATQVGAQVAPTGGIGTPNPTDVGSLMPKGTAEFGKDFTPSDAAEGGDNFGANAVPSQAAEGKPEVPASQPFFGKGGQLNAVLNDPGARLGLAALPAAATLLNGQSAVPSAITPLQPGGSLTGPLQNTATSQLAGANAGTLAPGQAASVAQFRQQAENALFQQLANEGVADPRSDSRYVAGMQQIEQQAQVMTQQFINQEFQTGFAAAGQAAGTLGQAASAEVGQDKSFQDALSSALQAFGQVEGIGSLERKAA